MHSLTLQKAAERLGITRPALIKRMRDAGLLNDKKLPAHPMRDRAHLFIHDGQWFHPQLGMQYSQSTRVRGDSLRWLAVAVGLEQLPEPKPDPRDVA